MWNIRRDQISIIEKHTIFLPFESVERRKLGISYQIHFLSFTYHRWQRLQRHICFLLNNKISIDFIRCTDAIRSIENYSYIFGNIRNNML